MTNRPSWRPPSRSARPLTWVGDSSAHAMSTPPPLRTLSAASWSVRVDLPIPGSPPMRVTEPATRPPPSARSSSLIPVATGWNDAEETSVIGMAPPMSDGTEATTQDSSRVFHSPQPGQQPTHLGWEAPQPEQMNDVRPAARPDGLLTTLRLPVGFTRVDTQATLERACDKTQKKPVSPLLARRLTALLSEQARKVIDRGMSETLRYERRAAHENRRHAHRPGRLQRCDL